MEMTADVHAGQSIYTRWTLNWAYDLFVLSYSNRFAWRCSSHHLLDNYNRNITANHLDIGVGTGYYLAHCRYPSRYPRLALMDINENSLKRAGARTRHLAPEIYRRNVLKPIPFERASFDSIGMTYLLHCLPGTMAEKSIVFDHVKPLMNPGAVLFGASIMQGDVPITRRARQLLDLYNAKGIFSNSEDSVAALKDALQQRFAESEVEVRGCVALFRARNRCLCDVSRRR